MSVLIVSPTHSMHIVINVVIVVIRILVSFPQLKDVSVVKTANVDQSALETAVVRVCVLDVS